MTNEFSKKLIKYISIVGMIASCILAVIAWREGLLTDPDKMEKFVNDTGIWGIIFFFIIQIIQVIIPIIPGGVTCLVGVLMFGEFYGFIINYTSICIGSMMAFGIARNYGKPILHKMFSEESIEKYEKWTDTNNRFTKFFAIMMLSPISPDDFLCYLAGTTNMTWKQFTIILWICKPTAIIVYSLGLVTIYNNIVAFFVGH